MENLENPPAGEVKLPHSLDDVHPLMREAATSVYRCQLPLKADATIRDAADALQELLFEEGFTPDIKTSDTSMVNQSLVLDQAFHTLVCQAMSPDGRGPYLPYLELALKFQRQSQSTVHGLHKRKMDRQKNSKS